MREFHRCKFNNLNLRNESNSASFANDLRKTRSISRILVSPAMVNGAKKVEDLAADAKLFVATLNHPFVEYQLPKSITDETLKSQSCMNLITNSQLKLVLEGNREFSRLNFWPAANSGEYFTLGCAELFMLE